jgi:hypothetical protein
MAVFNLKDLLASLGPEQRVIGIDPGSKIIGLALSDVGRRLEQRPRDQRQRGGDDGLADRRQEHRQHDRGGSTVRGFGRPQRR